MTTATDNVRELRRRWAWEEVAWWDRRAEDIAPGWRKEIVLRRDHPVPYIERLAHASDPAPLVSFLQGLGWVPLTPASPRLRCSAVRLAPLPSVTVVCDPDGKGKVHTTHAPLWAVCTFSSGMRFAEVLYTVPRHVRDAIPSVRAVGGWQAVLDLLSAYTFELNPIEEV